VASTLNAFDNTGDSRATVVIFQTYGGNKRPDRPNGGFYVEETEQAKTLDSSNGLNPSASQGGIIIFTAQRVGEPPRIYENITPSLLSRMRTGGNNTPMIASYSIREDAKANTFSATETEVSLALNALQPSPQSHHAQMFIAEIPDDPREETASPASRVIGFSHTQGLDPQPSEIATPTLQSNGAGMAVAYDEYNDTINPDIHHAIRAGTKQSTEIITEAVVRRLTPTECERLMGWPDNHTLHRADNKTNSDSTRYKMCGNGVATPVAQWIATQLKELL
jgi:site-specific DNA-cytosine methylase